MSETRPRNYQPKLFMLGEEEIEFVNLEALVRNPEQGGKREQSGVVRDAIAFARDNYTAFKAFVANRAQP
jgi:hypothetical protein